MIGVLLTFALIVQFASFLADVDRSPTAQAERRAGLLRGVILHRRRFVEVVVDGVVITAAFYGAYVLRLGSNGTPTQQLSLRDAAGPAFARYLVFIPIGLYRGVWRYADVRDAIRDRGRRAGLGVPRVRRSCRPRDTANDFPRAIFVIDAVLCTLLIGASRFWERAAYRGVTTLHDVGPPAPRARRRRRARRPKLRARAPRDAGRAGRRLRRRRFPAVAAAAARRAGPRQRRRDAPRSSPRRARRRLRRDPGCSERAARPRAGGVQRGRNRMSARPPRDRAALVPSPASNVTSIDSRGGR